MARDGNYQPLTGGEGYQNFTPATAEGLTLTTAQQKSARFALIKPETQPVRWRDDGTDPTAAAGMLIDVGDEFWYSGKPEKIKFIDTAAGASTVHVTLYK